MVGRQLALTSGNTQHPHDADDGGVDGQRGIDLNLLQCDAHDGQQHNGQVQLVPPGWVGRHGSVPASASPQHPGPSEHLQASTFPSLSPGNVLVSPGAALLSTVASAGSGHGTHLPCPTHLSLKNLRNPKATSFSTASTTKTMVNT